MGSGVERRVVKIASFAWLSALYFALAIAATLVGDFFTTPVDRERDDGMPLWKILAEFLVYVWYLTIVVYASRAIVKNIPFPLDGAGGFAYSDIRERMVFPLYAPMLIAFSETWIDKTAYVFERLGVRKRPNAAR
jgi:hypothetical protein